MGLFLSLGGGTNMVREGDSDGIWEIIEAGMRLESLLSPR